MSPARPLEVAPQQATFQRRSRAGVSAGRKFRHASRLTAAVRVFIVNYFREVATEEGDANISHGTLYHEEALVLSTSADFKLRHHLISN